jgi:hypothetical protein
MGFAQDEAFVFKSMKNDKILVSLSLEKKATERNYGRNRNIKDITSQAEIPHSQPFLVGGDSHGSGGICYLIIPAVGLTISALRYKHIVLSLSSQPDLSGFPADLH